MFYGHNFRPISNTGGILIAMFIQDTLTYGTYGFDLSTNHLDFLGYQVNEWQKIAIVKTEADTENDYYFLAAGSPAQPAIKRFPSTISKTNNIYNYHIAQTHDIWFDTPILFNTGISGTDSPGYSVGLNGADVYQICSLELSASYTKILTLPTDRTYPGDAVYLINSGGFPHLIVSNTKNSIRYITQFSLLTGSVVKEVVNTSGDDFKGMFHNGDYYYGITSDGRIYRITSTGVILLSIIPNVTVSSATQIYVPHAKELF